MTEAPAALVARRLPGLTLLRRYQRAWLVPDLVAGLTVGAMLVPQSMGYADLAGLAPQYGFYAAIGALVVYAVVGSSRHLGVGPEPGTAVLAAAGVGALAGGDPRRYTTLMAALALVVAGLCVVGSVLRLGHLASLLSRPVLVGYITGVGLTLVSSQLAAFTGVRITADSFFPRFGQFLTHLGDVHGTTLAVGAASLALMLVLRWRFPTFPAALTAVVAATVASAALGLEDSGVAVVGTIPAGLPTPAWPDAAAHDFARLLPAAAGIALVGFADNVLTARAIGRKQGYRIDPNQELFALGAVNLTAGLSQGFPISSSASRTAVPASLGSRTQLVSIVASAFVVATLLGLRPALAHLPRTALAAVILMAAIAIIDVPGFVGLWRISGTEALLAGITTTAVIVLGVLPGVVVAVLLSLAVALRRLAHPHDAVLGDVPDLDGWVDVGEFPSALAADGLLVFRFDAPLFFFNAERFVERVEHALVENPGDEEWLVIDCEGIGSIDVTATDGLRDLLDRMADAHVSVVALARANDRVLDTLRRAELLEPEGPLREFPTINRAVRAFRNRHQPLGDEPVPHDPAGDAPPPGDLDPDPTEAPPLA